MGVKAQIETSSPIWSLKSGLKMGSACGAGTVQPRAQPNLFHCSGHQGTSILIQISAGGAFREAVETVETVETIFRSYRNCRSPVLSTRNASSSKTSAKPSPNSRSWSRNWTSWRPLNTEACWSLLMTRWLRDYPLAVGDISNVLGIFSISFKQSSTTLTLWLLRALHRIAWHGHHGHMVMCNAYLHSYWIRHESKFPDVVMFISMNGYQ